MRSLIYAKQKFINEALERPGSIVQAQRHPHILIEAERGDDSSLGDVIRVDRNLMEGLDEVNSGEDGRTVELRRELDVGDRITVLFRHGVESSVVSTRPYVSIPLVDNAEC